MKSTIRLLLLFTISALALHAMAARPTPIENPQGKFLIWNDYKIEVNQFGGLGRNWPHGIVWQQYDILKQKAAENPEDPNTIRGVLLLCPVTHATEYDGDKKVDEKTTSMTSSEVKWALEQWRQWEEMIYVYSGGAAWQRTDLKVVDEPLNVRTKNDWHFWSGPKRNFIDKYIPFERGDYDSYNSIYNSKGLKAGPWGGTFGAEIGPLGCGSSDNAWLSRGHATDEREGFVFWHEWLNQMCWATSNVMPYPQGLWSLYVFGNMGYRNDPINAWPWITSHRDVMQFIIRPGMWRRWTITDPYISPAIDMWEVFGPRNLTSPGNTLTRQARGNSYVWTSTPTAISTSTKPVLPGKHPHGSNPGSAKEPTISAALWRPTRSRMSGSGPEPTSVSSSGSTASWFATDGGNSGRVTRGA